MYTRTERAADQSRPVSIELNYYEYAEGSCFVKFGNTEIICVATIDNQAPPHLRGSGKGWVTGEYGMLPRSSPERIRRERGNVSGRTQEIQRLIGRTLRSIVNLEGWGERTIQIDCDVIKADGGTRTASITGAFVALVLAFRHLRKEGYVQNLDLKFPVKDYLSAISVGVVDGKCLLDLEYIEDSQADTDMNLVMTASGNFVEIQGTAEKEPFGADTLAELLSIGKKGCTELCDLQKKLLGSLDW
ncbi:MAG: ribonuclease PH [Bdellovibrionota bacterium]